jgi:D-alanyl-D-alanine carboxypeptidase (penicillin-binding protein 5/6)
MMKSLSKTVLSAYLLFLLWLVLYKFSFHIVETFDFQIRGLNLTPFAGITQNSSRDMVYNVLFFVPFGLLLGVNLKRATFWRKLGYVFFFSLIAEVIQYVFAIGISDITDVITNTAGGLLGLALYDLTSKHVYSKRLDRWSTAVVGILLAVACAFVFSFQISHNKNRRPLTAKPVQSQISLDKDVQLAWPADGQAAVGTVESGVLATSSDNQKPLSTASMAKIITALAIIEKQPLKQGQTGPSYTLTAKDVANYRIEADRGGSTVAVQEGMVLTQYQALQMILIASANNMADSLAEKTFGSTEAYTAYAQDMLHRMGLSQTVIADASGFSSETVSTPSELIAIGIAALKNPVIAEIVAQQQAQIPGVGIITNTNQLLGVDGVVGIKTGTTDQAGKCLLFAGRYTDKNGQKVTIVGVIMGGGDTLFSDSEKLLASTKQALGVAETRSGGNDVVAPPSEQEHRGHAPGP